MTINPAIRPVTTNLVLILASNLDSKTNESDNGIKCKHIICIASIMLVYSGKNIGIVIGRKIMPRIVIPTEHMTLKIFSLLFSILLESSESKYLKIIPENIANTVMNCIPKLKFPKIVNPKIGATRSLSICP